MTIFGRQPAFWIGLIVTLLLGALQTLAGEGLISDAVTGQVTDAVNAVAQLALLVAPLVTGMLIKPSVTPIADPVLKKDTEVRIEGSNDTVIIKASPPGPIGVEGGSSPPPTG